MTPVERREAWSENVNSCSRATSGALVSGLVIAGIGVILLLDRFDVVSASILFRLWPLVFVFIGVGRLLESHSTTDQVWCGFLISIGSLLTLHELGFIGWGIGKLWPLFLIGAGLMLAWHSNEIRIGRKGISLPEGARFTGLGGGPLASVAFFGGIERRVEGTIVEGGNLIAFFGGFKIDLSRAEMEGERAIIDATAIFGGGEIIVPEWWKVSVEGLGIFGGYVDKTRHIPRPDRPVKTVIVRGAAIFGGIEVKSY